MAETTGIPKQLVTPQWVHWVNTPPLEFQRWAEDVSAILTGGIEGIDVVSILSKTTETLEGQVDALITLSGVASGDEHFGAFTDSLLSDDLAAKALYQELEDEAEAVRTLTGTAAGDDDLGTFTGDIISNDATIKDALQELETGTEDGLAEAGVHFADYIDPPNLYKWRIPASVTYETNIAYNLVADRLYYQPFFVDRAISLKTTSIPMSVAAALAGGVMRAGLYELDGLNPTTNDYTIGALLQDFGTESTDTAGHLQFGVLGIILQPGMYALCCGSDQAVTVRYARTMIPAMNNMQKFGAGATSAWRQAVLLQDSGENTQIVSGLTKENFQPADITSTRGTIYSAMWMDYTYSAV